MQEIKNILESILFVSGAPLPLENFKKLLPEFNTSEIKMALEHLQKDYDEKNGGFYLSEIAGGYQFRSQPKYKDWIKRLIDAAPHRLSPAALETLAIIAYKQPIIRSDVEHIRGVDSGGVIRMLLDRNLVRVLGRKDIPGRPMIYGTSKRFLEIFGLKDLKDLPSIKEIEELGKES